MLSSTETRDQPIVRRADNPNRQALERIDADTGIRIAELAKSDESYQQIAAEVVVAGVQMCQRRQTDPEAWLAFAKPLDIRVKREDREFGEIAAALWRSLNNEPRERRRKWSQYGRAIGAVQDWYVAGLAGPRDVAPRIVGTRRRKSASHCNYLPSGQ